MKKLLSLAVVFAALAVSVGCDNKASTGGTPVKMTPTGSSAATHTTP